MVLSDISVKRPVFATVISLLLVAFGILSFMELPLREYPDTSPPIVSVSTSYPGASAEIVEQQITQLIEDQINGVEGVTSISSSSSDGSSRVSVEFEVGRDIDQAANDIRDKISRVTRRLPEDVDPPEIAKADADGRPIAFFNLTSTRMSFLELNDYAERYIVDQFAVIDGVANVSVRGTGGYAMRVWLDRVKLAARGLTVTDVESALRRQNLELPAGRVDSVDREFTVRVDRVYQTPDDFSRLVIGRGQDGHQITLGEVARVELGAASTRSVFQGNGTDAVGLGLVKQSNANSLSVLREAKALTERINATLPDHMTLVLSNSDAEFIENAISSVYSTIFLTIALVSLVIYMFLGSIRSMLIPAVTIPVCLLAAFIVLLAFGLTINLITLLAMVLCVGLIVDDSIVVLENIQRRVEAGEPPLLAAFNGSRQVGFAVIATTLVLIAVFVPVVFMEGNMGILFYELAITIGGAVVFSTVLALSLTPMMSSKLLNNHSHESFLTRKVDQFFRWLQRGYHSTLEVCLKFRSLVVAGLFFIGIAVYFLWQQVPSEFAPQEDQGVMMARMSGPEGASMAYMQEQTNLLQDTLMPYLDRGEVKSIVTMLPGFGGGSGVSSGMTIIALPDWAERPRETTEIMGELMTEWRNIPGLETMIFMRSGLVRGGGGQPVQFVIGGRTYEELAQWRDMLIEQGEASGLFTRMTSDFLETRPSLTITVDKVRAADLGVSIQSIGRTLQAMMNESRVTTFVDAGEEYDVILQAEETQRASPDDLTNIYVRSESTGQLIPMANLIRIENTSSPNSLNRYNRVRAITISAGLQPGVTLDEGLAFLENLVLTELPEYAQIDYKGESLELKEASGGLVFIFAMSLLVVYLVLAAQFESFIHPLVIMTTVPLAIFGALIGLLLTDGTLNIYTNIGLIVLVGIASKNGILIVEFANQLRDEGKAFREALVEACDMRLRPVLMTALSTMMGSLPLIFSTGAGSESRMLLGTVIFSGVLMTTLMTLFVVPVVYDLLARNTGSPQAVSNLLNTLQSKYTGARSAPLPPHAGGADGQTVNQRLDDL
ncbi:efflux RND transporter permease subunit [Pseudohongiella spirulinae]|uniref:Acriflavin resistance protein n=1 Tax=Pseudohongiella spirulinae TaxID=1249552 RepID=A0A0S2KDV0_9GAMM|nr:efflux RND transporter permease subunit [Pseudohongiella spirulinae]ALO46260.1 Acriflavin resistance protein [Pseudohongiella spirulinae]